MTNLDTIRELLKADAEREAKQRAAMAFNYWKKAVVETNNPTIHPKSDTEFYLAGAQSRDEIILGLVAALEEQVEFTSCHLETVEHCFDNKCVPTVDEVNQCAIADSSLRLALGKLHKKLGAK